MTTPPREPAKPSIDDFFAHAMYLSECRALGKHGVTWACMAPSERQRYLGLAMAAYDSWVQMEDACRQAREAGNPKGYWVP